MQQETWMFVIGVGNDLHTSHGDVSDMGHHFNRIGIPSSANKEDQPTKSSGHAAGSQIVRELAAGDLIVVWI
jgi:hypothetical protein